MLLFSVFLLFIFGNVVKCESSSNNRPVIGILMLPKYGPKPDYNVTSNYIAASYVKWIESGGARVVPLEISLNPSTLDPILNKLSGVLFTGGGVDFTYKPYFGTLSYIANFTRNKFEKENISIPIWSTCLGFEALLVAEAGGLAEFQRDTCKCHNMTLPVMFHEEANSVMFDSPEFGMRGAIAHDIFAKQNSTQNEHGRCIFPSTFENNLKLRQTFNVLGTSFDENGAEFITLIENKINQPPMYGAQFHPEKPSYEWIASHPIPRTNDVIYANFYLSSFFVEESRKSSNRMTDEIFKTISIYNYQPIYLGGYYEQQYIFPLSKEEIIYNEKYYTILDISDLQE